MQKHLALQEDSVWFGNNLFNKCSIFMQLSIEIITILFFFLFCIQLSVLPFIEITNTCVHFQSNHYHNQIFICERVSIQQQLVKLSRKFDQIRVHIFGKSCNAYTTNLFWWPARSPSRRNFMLVFCTSYIFYIF